MNTLNLNSKKNILNNYKYQHSGASRYSGNQTGQNPTKQISFNSGMFAGTRETSATLCQLKGKSAQKGFPVNKTKYCTAVNKTEYKSGTSPSNVSFGGLASNKLFKKLLEKSEANGALCSAAAMLLACCVLRPISIMTSENVEKENRMIAATKSIASGIIGFVLMFLVSKPIEHAIKKINENPEKYLDKNAMQKLLQGNAKNTEKSRVYNVATRFFKSAADMVTAAPKGSLTIILIPPLLNVIFKKERAKKQGKELPQTNLLIQHTPNVNDVEDYAEQKHYVFFKGDKNSKNLVSFKGLYQTKMYNNFTEKLAQKFGKVLSNEKVQNWADKLKNTSIESHVMALSGTIVSTFYVINTMLSKKIEESRKEPLIYNSVISWALANIGAYTIDGVLNKHIKAFEKEYKKVNANDTNLDKQLRGIKIVKSALIFGMMYRWVTPWISTILAEKVWNKKHEKQNIKKAQA